MIEESIQGMNAADQNLVKRALSRVDFSYLKDSRDVQTAVKSIIKTFNFLGFFDPNQKVTVKDKNGKGRACLDVLGDVMAVKLALSDSDRDLVVMRHVFKILDPATN